MMKKILSGKYYLIATAVVQCLFWGSLFASSLLRDGFFGFLGDMGEIVFLLFFALIFLLVPLGIFVFFTSKAEKKYTIIGLVMNVCASILFVWAFYALLHYFNVPRGF
jgi:hypothetical protein